MRARYSTGTSEYDKSPSLPSTAAVVPTTVSTTFTYDSGDKRVKRVSTGDTTTYYWYSGGGDSPSVTMTGGPGAFVVSDYVIGLPGGVTFNRQMAPSLNVRWSLSSIHGDLLAVTNDVGVKQGSTYRWDPDGLPIAGTAQPDLMTGKFENGWLGEQQRMTDTSDSSNPIVEMGARVYLPRLGRFTTPDPVEGGVGDSDYLYPTDPVNGYDLTGSRETDGNSPLITSGVQEWDGDADVYVFVDDDLVDAVTAAAAMWAGAGVRIRAVALSNLSRFAGRVDVFIQFGQTSNVATGVEGSDEIVVNEKYFNGLSSDSKRAEVIAHEIGHWFGLSHSANNQGLMRRTVSSGRVGVISEQELAYVRSRVK